MRKVQHFESEPELYVVPVLTVAGHGGAARVLSSLLVVEELAEGETGH